MCIFFNLFHSRRSQVDYDFVCQFDYILFPIILFLFFGLRRMKINLTNCQFSVIVSFNFLIFFQFPFFLSSFSFFPFVQLVAVTSRFSFFLASCFWSAILGFHVCRLVVSNFEFLFLFAKCIMFTFFGLKFLIVRHAEAVSEGKFLGRKCIQIGERGDIPLFQYTPL